MLSARVLATVTAAVLVAQPPTALQVLSSSPSGEAALTAPVQVIFDRPVAGSLDRSVDPGAIFRITPAVPGKVEWRDPVTLRFRPESPLAPGQSYTVTIANSFTAMDGSRLTEPYTYTFSVTGPALLGGLPVNAGEHPRFLTPDATFELIYSAPIDQSLLKELAYLEFDPTCQAPGIIKLAVTGQRPITDKDPWQYREAGGWERDHSTDPLRRVVALAPERKLPLGCAGRLATPTAVDPEGTKPYAKWNFSTYGEFRLDSATCASGETCPAGGIRVRFSTPVKGAEVERRLTILPPAPFTISDTSEESSDWYLEAQLTPRTGYAVVADTAIRDIFGQRLVGNPAAGFRTSGFAPLVDHEYGRMTIERVGFRTLAVKHVNVDTLLVTIAPVPSALIPGILQYNRWNRDDTTLARVLKGAVTQRVAVPGPRDRVRIFGAKLPAYNMLRPGSPLLQLVKVTSPSLSAEWQKNQPYAVVQVTDLAVHARIGLASGVVWVTGVSDGQPRGGAVVTLYDTRGRPRATARTAPDGTAILGNYQSDSSAVRGSGFEGYVIASLGADQAVTAINSYDPDLSPWQFNVRSGYGAERYPMAAAVFTERGIYRPGEPLYAKAIVRSGSLGSLAVPSRGDSLRWVFQSRDGGSLKEATVALSPFGTSDQTFALPQDLALGTYSVRVEQRRSGVWLDLASATYRVAEYRPPEFQVDAVADSGVRFPGDSAAASIEARYLFGAPMARAALTWSARQIAFDPGELGIPGTEGFYFGDTGWWWEETEDSRSIQLLGQGSDTLDGHGRAVIRFPLAQTIKGRPARAVLEASVTDVNRQSVATQASVLVHAASFYIGAKPLGQSYFWTAGQPQAIGVIAVQPDGKRLPAVQVKGTIVRREWHRVHRTRGGYSEVYGDWVSDTVGHCDLVTAGKDPVECRFTPAAGGTYIVSLAAQDAKGRPVSTSLYRWATGKDFVPWNDESQFKMDVVPDRTRYSVGDTATVLFAAPFTDAEAWVTVEREGLIEQRRLRVTSGSTTLKFPVTEAWAPNAFVSILVARGRSAKPGPLDDPGRPTIRVGYAELRATPEVKRLAVKVTPLQQEYRPGDTARVKLAVTDRGGRGQRTEVTLWAVDEGVLSLTGYKLPDPIDLLYAPRGLGLRLASNVTTVAPQVPEGEKGGRAPGGGGGAGESDILRSRFKATAFFLGSVLTDSAGTALAKAKLPDNLTTFRMMAVAVTAGDRYGSGQSPMLVTRPLLARPALPRFLREGDRYAAGVVVNQRAGGTPTVTVTADAAGAALAGDATRTAVLEAGRGREVRFDFRQPGAGPLGETDSATFRFKVSGAGDADAVQQRLAVKPSFRPRAWTVSGTLVDTATVEFLIPDSLDPERSRLQLTMGSSPLAVIKGLSYELKVYPYFCSEQVSSVAQPLIALYRAQQGRKGLALLQGNPMGEIDAAVQILSRRQRSDGAIGYWSSSDWSTPWLSAYAGLTLLDARSAGAAVDDSVLSRLARYLRGTLDNPQPIRAPVIDWYNDLQARLGDQVAATDFLSRLGRPHIAAENELLRNAPQLAWEDRVRLAEVLARRKAFKAARGL
ncbi:MAG TPA: MG2 domain-containing protein, partial [Gemmatimonadales bacterium]|nr:MG2 domain-containing protein [Gemmatimonadales bacterium]